MFISAQVLPVNSYIETTHLVTFYPSNPTKSQLTIDRIGGDRLAVQITHRHVSQPVLTRSL